MSDERPFWLTKRLDEMTQAEWESLCDGCGICCLYKLEDEDSGEVFMTNVACRFLDREACVCVLYEERRSAMPTCIQLTPAKVAQLNWLPDTCAYRLVLQGKPLPAWHPLVSGSRESVHEADISVRGKVISEVDVNMDDLEEYVVEESD